MGDEGFDLLAGSLTEGLGAAEVDGVGLDEVGVELMLADQLAEAVAGCPGSASFQGVRTLCLLP